MKFRQHLAHGEKIPENLFPIGDAAPTEADVSNGGDTFMVRKLFLMLAMTFTFAARVEAQLSIFVDEAMTEAVKKVDADFGKESGAPSRGNERNIRHASKDN